MFSLFTKKRHPASELYDHYSEEEKLIILSLLFLAGSCDNNIVASNRSRINAELKFLNLYVTIFEVKARKSQDFLDSLGSEVIVSRFSAFDKSKINIVLVMIFEMLTCDGQINDLEGSFLITILNKLNISLESFAEQMNKNKAIYNSLMV